MNIDTIPAIASPVERIWQAFTNTSFALSHNDAGHKLSFLAGLHAGVELSGVLNHYKAGDLQALFKGELEKATFLALCDLQREKHPYS